MVLGQHRRAVGTFYNRIDAEHALNELLAAGFPIDQISWLLKTDRDDQLVGAVMSMFGTKLLMELRHLVRSQHARCHRRLLGRPWSGSAESVLCRSCDSELL